MMGRAHKLQSQLRKKCLHEAGWQRGLLVDGGPGNVECPVEPVVVNFIPSQCLVAAYCLYFPTSITYFWLVSAVFRHIYTPIAPN
jgi:hypothetical protein